MKKVALLATGDEVLNGDITDGNGQFISQTLFEHGIRNGLHLISPDEEAELIRSMSFLLEHHDALITTGGLGPTSDDRTRFALSKVSDIPLITNDEAMAHLKARFAERQLAFTDNNKQQTLFPENATLFLNPNGSACGCEFTAHGKLIFILPGPPKECLPMFEQHVLPSLLKADFAEKVFRQKWLLSQVSESQIASELDPLAEQYDCVIGYRVMKPKLEVKIEARDEAVFHNIAEKIEEIIRPHLI